MKISSTIAAIAISATTAFAESPSAPREIPSPAEVATKLSELFLTTDPTYYNPQGYKGGRPHGEHEYIHYATVSLWVNAMDCMKTIDSPVLQRLIAAFEPYYAEKRSVMNEYRHVDLSIVGAIPLEIAILTGDERAAKLGLHYADRQWSAPKEDYNWGDRWYDKIPFAERQQWYQKGYTPETRLWIDDMYMITVLQSQAFRLTGDYKYMERAGREMRLYIERLQREDGLFNHSYAAPFAWGRGNGWMAAGMALNLKYLKLDDPNRDAVLAGYRKMMRALLANQRPSGLWGQLVDDGEAWDETSASAMFAYAIQEGVNNGWLVGEATDAKAAVQKAYRALVSKLDKYGNIPDVCCSTGWKNDRNYYLKRGRVNGDPHGQAPLLWLCLALLSAK